MNGQQQAEDRLWDYIDGLGDASEKSAIEQLIATNIDWQNKYHELLEVHQLMNSSELDAPSLRFTKNVMEDIARHHVAPATSSYINKKIIWGIGGFFIIMMLGFLVFAFSQAGAGGGGGSGSSTSMLPQYDLNKLDWSKFFSNTYTNIFMMINVVLGLVLLDMYLQRKKETRSHNEA
jgi:anti-sigma factor RsiW